jgi:hypothetical protein
MHNNRLHISLITFLAFIITSPAFGSDEKLNDEKRAYLKYTLPRAMTSSPANLKSFLAYYLTQLGTGEKEPLADISPSHALLSKKIASSRPGTPSPTGKNIE